MAALIPLLLDEEGEEGTEYNMIFLILWYKQEIDHLR